MCSWIMFETFGIPCDINVVFQISPSVGTEGRRAMLDANAIGSMVGVLRETVEAAAEYCVATTIRSQWFWQRRRRRRRSS